MVPLRRARIRRCFTIHLNERFAGRLTLTNSQKGNVYVSYMYHFLRVMNISEENDMYLSIVNHMNTLINNILGIFPHELQNVFYKRFVWQATEPNAVLACTGCNDMLRKHRRKLQNTRWRRCNLFRINCPI